MEESSDRISEQESRSRDFAEDFPELDSIGSWADEVDSDFDAHEAESESTEAIKFNPKYACQAQKLKESLPATSSVEKHFERGQHEHRFLGDIRSHNPSKFKRSSSHNSRSYDGKESGKYRNHNRRSENSQEKFSRRPQSSDLRYKRDLGGQSPQRSPLNSRSTSVNHEKHRYCRRQSHGKDHRRTQFHDGIDEHCENTRKRHRTPSHTQTVFSEEDEEGTPILSKWQTKEPKWARTRRRLCLPEDVPDQTNVEAQMEELSEDDEERLARREKDIVYGKSTESYQKYIHLVPRESRHEDCKVHPRTPLKTRKCSRRSWDAQIRIWKLRVHTWAAQTAETADFLKPQESKYPVNSGPRWADVVAGNSTSNSRSCDDAQAKATENVSDDEDDSFLDGFDFECKEITDQMNDSVKLNSVSELENLSQDKES